MNHNIHEVKAFLHAADDLFPVPLSQKQDLDVFAVKLCDRATLCSVFEDGRILSMVAGYTENVVNDMAYISIVATLPDAQGRGLASKLILEFIEICRQKQLEAVHLYAVRSNHPAIVMYRSLGFQEWKTEDEPRPDDIHFIFYLKEDVD